MSADFLLEAFERYGERTAIIWNDEHYSYAWLREQIESYPVPTDRIFGLSADYSPKSLAILLALLHHGKIVAPLTAAFERQKEEFYRIAEISTEIAIDDSDGVTFNALGHRLAHPLLLELAEKNSGGLILFSSGSTGKAKAVVHDGARLLNKYRTPRRATVTIPFMLFDHIGGMNTVLHVLSSGGTAVFAPERTPETICTLVQDHRVEVLPTSPTFVNLLLLSDYRRFDLSSLKIIAYGAERMPPATLERLAAAFPNVELIQNYGLSEVGIMATKSEANASLWMRLGGDGYQTRVRDGLLEIKAETAMVGYLNEVSPFTEDGWLKTGDQVEQKGDFIRVLGRSSDLIIIGGEKVYPAEIEDLLAAMPGVLEVVVSAEQNALTGSLVRADVRLCTEETRAEFRARMIEHLTPKLIAYKIPQKVALTKEPLHNARFKKLRNK